MDYTEKKELPTGPEREAVGTVCDRTVRYDIVERDNHWRLTGADYIADMMGVARDTHDTRRVAITGNRDGMIRDAVLFKMAQEDQ